MELDLLVERAKRGEPAALDELFRSLAPAVRGYLGLRGAREPDDLTSETFIAVFRNVHTFKGNAAKFRSWVFVIAHRRLIDERRACAREPHFASLNEVGIGAVDHADAALSAATVKALCSALAPDQADVMILRILGDLTIEQIAEVVGKSPGAVKQLQRRGLDALRRLTKSEQAIPL